jgi:hypothetical protein
MKQCNKDGVHPRAKSSFIVPLCESLMRAGATRASLASPIG